jgi:hypothetical protein
MNLGLQLIEEGFATALTVDGTPLVHQSTGLSFTGIIEPLPSVSPENVILGMDFRETAILHVLRRQCPPIVESDWISDGDSFDRSIFYPPASPPDPANPSTLWPVLYKVTKREDNPSDAVVRFTLVKITEADNEVPPPAPPLAPQSLRIVQVTATTISVQWAQLVRPPVPVAFFTVKWGNASGKYQNTAQTTGGSYVLTGLTPSTVYFITVSATATAAAGGLESPDATELQASTLSAAAMAQSGGYGNVPMASTVTPTPTPGTIGTYGA